MVVLDPSRVFVGKPESFGGYGDYLATMCERYGAVGGINGGAYYDVDGAGLGGTPQGLTIIDGVCYDDARRRSLQLRRLRRESHPAHRLYDLCRRHRRRASWTA